MLACLFLCGGQALAAEGSVIYRARIVHDDRANISYVDGHIDLGSQSYEELIGQSYSFNWRSLPAQMLSTRSALPAVWSDGEHTAQRLGEAFPRYDSPLLRHFIVGRVIANPGTLKAGDSFLDGQLEIGSTETGEDSFEIIAAYRGSPLVVFGKLQQRAGHTVAGDFGVLDVHGELYQYFMDEIDYSPQQLAVLPSLPQFDPSEYVSFKAGTEQVPIKPVKDWLVFQASLPNGRPLNLVFDSGAEQMIIDDQVLQLDAGLHSQGNIKVGGALENENMQLYNGFSFEVGGVSFRNMPVIGTQLTTLGYGADLRIHGIVGNEILQLCRLDLDLDRGLMSLNPPGSGERPSGQELALTFIRDLPHVEADVNASGPSLLLLDTGQRAPLSMNLDWVEEKQLSDDLKMNGFLGDVTGGFAPRYILEELDINLAGRDYPTKIVDAGYERSYDFSGRSVVGAIGFPMLSSHFGGITFDYSQQKIYLRNPGTDLNFTGNDEAWDPLTRFSYLASADKPDDGSKALAAGDADPFESMEQSDPRRPSLLRDGDARKPRDERSAQAWVDKVKSVHDPLHLLRQGQYGDGPIEYWNDDEQENDKDAGSARIRLPGDSSSAGQDLLTPDSPEQDSSNPALAGKLRQDGTIGPTQTPLEFRNLDFATRLQVLRNVRIMFKYMQNTAWMLRSWKSAPGTEGASTELPRRSRFDYSQSPLEFEQPSQ
jgi:prepilin-type processing-associated H-X9-DG protein